MNEAFIQAHAAWQEFSLKAIPFYLVIAVTMLIAYLVIYKFYPQSKYKKPLHKATIAVRIGAIILLLMLI